MVNAFQMDMDMFWLPKLSVGPVHWRLPLTEPTATAIVAVLFSRSQTSSHEAFRHSAATDPALALWLLCRFPRDRVPTGSDELAEWFLRDPGLHLTWNLTDDEPPSATWNLDRWSDLARRCRFVSRRAGEISGESPHADRFRLIGLLHASFELLALCGPTVEQAPSRDQPSCLPAWLATAIRHSSRVEPTTAEFECVWRAMAELERHPLDLGDDETASTGPAASCAAALPHMTHMLARLATLENTFDAAVETAKLDAMRELAYGASHEINNPLANISTRAQTLLVGETDPERRRKLATINSQAFRAHEMISDIMLFAKPPRIEPTSTDVGELIHEVLHELAADAKEQGTELRCNLQDDPISVLADRGHLAVAINALLRNSMEAIGMGGHVELTARTIDAVSPDDSQVEFVVCDTGPGVSTEARRSIFNPFYSGREAGRGLGLGLSKCWRIITLHGGRITLDDTYADGARFVILLPAGVPQPDSPALAAHG